jgi:uncharacterized coiled-coil protein SlyX
MDRHFLEFWGKFLLNAAKSQKQLEDLTTWLQSGGGTWPDFTALFQQAYGLEHVEQNRPDYLKLWEQAEANFRQSCREYLNLLGGVPQEEYQALAARYEKLEKQAAQQEETIRQLKKLLEDKGLGLAVANLEFQELIRKQGEQFQELLQGMAESMKPDQEED